jgi:hypothetical protein
MALSTFESEYYTIIECAKEVLRYKNIFNELKIKTMLITKLLFIIAKMKRQIQNLSTLTLDIIK